MSLYVVFFGGYQSSQHDMNVWLASARKQRPDVTFDAYPYPAHAKSSDAGAVQGFDKQFDKVIGSIESADAEALFIVGHSSGCAIANELNARVGGDHSQTTLVDLDGFVARSEQVKNSTVQAWSAEGPRGKGHSVNYKDWKNIYTALHATEPWSLHFSLVNVAATNRISLKTYATEGYRGCVANLCWLSKKT